MKNLKQKIGKLGIILLTSTLVLIGCNKEKQRPYEQIELSELSNHVDKKIVIEGLPSLVRKDGFVLSDEKNIIYIERNVWRKASRITGIYEDARRALEEEIADGDSEKVRVYGLAKEDNTVEARFVEVKGNLHEIYH